MTRRNSSRLSSIASSPFGHLQRFAAAAAFAFAALVLALSLSNPQPALAQGNSNSNSTSNQPAFAISNLFTQVSDLAAGQPAKTGSATILVYLNGSDLESQAGEATADIAEMLESGAGQNVNIIIETIGTRDWQDFGIASDHAQRYRVNEGALELVDDSLGQLDTTSADTLADFISWGTTNYPADRYILLFWDHGAGPVYGFGYDEFQDDYEALTLDEIQQALKANSNVHFDIIGMDCCIMSSLETCYVLQPFCDYSILSEDFEPGIGWSYANWLRVLENNPSISSVELGQTIVNDMIGDVKADKENGEATLALIDESAIDSLHNAWIDFAYANEKSLLGTNYSQEIEWRTRPNAVKGNGKAFDWEGMWDLWESDGSYVTMTDYFVTDILQVASSMENEEATTLKSALDNAIVHFGSTSGEVGMGGIGVTLPYGDAEFYDELASVFTACGIDTSYINWLESFVDAEGIDNHYGFQADDFTYGDYFGNGYDQNGFGYFDSDDYGSGHGYGYGSSHDFGYGYGYGHDFGYGDDFGYSNGHGSGYGSNSGNGYGYGYSHDFGYSNGQGHAQDSDWGNGSCYDYGYSGGSGFGSDYSRDESHSPDQNGAFYGSTWSR